jgi:hypothetical protein
MQAVLEQNVIWELCRLVEALDQQVRERCPSAEAAVAAHLPKPVCQLKLQISSE